MPLLPEVETVAYTITAVTNAALHRYTNSTNPSDVEKRSIEGGVALNIMPTGASITFGINSSDGNGYRKDLLDLLTSIGNPVNYIGTQHGGTMVHNANEGFPGKRIGQVDSLVMGSTVLNGKPNVILINLGTNVSVCRTFVACVEDEREMLTRFSGLRTKLQSLRHARPPIRIPRQPPSRRTQRRRHCLQPSAQP